MSSWSAEELCLRWVPRAAEIAYLLTGDRALSLRIARRALVRCTAHWQDRRNSYALEEWFDRTVISIAARSMRLGAIGRLRRRGALPAPARLESSDRLLWQALHSLRYKHRVAVVLKHHAGLTDRELADALGCSVAGARSLLGHGMESLEKRLGGVIDVASSLAGQLSRLAAHVDADALRDRAFIRRVESARWVGVLEAGAIAGGLALIMYLGGGAIASRESGSGEPPAIAADERDDNGGGRVQVGSPDWCPGIRGAESPVSSGMEGPIAGTAEPFAAGQAKGHMDIAATFVDPLAYGPPLETWPRLDYVSNMEVVYSISGGNDQGLRDACGKLVAERTWIIVFRVSKGDASDQLVLYLLRRGGDWKVWATEKPAIKL